MAKLKIITGEGNRILRARSKEVVKFDKDLQKFAKDLIDTMKAAKGLGIAAPQVGKNVRIFIATLGYKTGRGKATTERCSVVAMVNPVIVSHGADTEIDEEGCLSLPGQYGKVERFLEVKIKFFDLEGQKQVLELNGLDARVVQHELDHINGVLFVDRIKEMEQRENLMF